jgi:hypothetical protein
MKLTLRVGAAMGIIALAGCNQGSQDNYADNAGMNAGYANETVLPPDENTAGSDTLGNQMNQLNDSDMNISNADMNMSGNTTNSQ